MARTGPSGWRRRQRSVSAVSDEVEWFEHQLADQDLAPGRSHDGLGPRGKVSHLDRDVGHGPLLPPLVRVDDSRSPMLESQLRCDLLGDDQTHRPGVDHAFDRRSSDARLRAQPEADGSAVVPVPGSRWLESPPSSPFSDSDLPGPAGRPRFRCHRVGVVLLAVGVVSTSRPAGRLCSTAGRIPSRPTLSAFPVIAAVVSPVYCRFWQPCSGRRTGQRAAEICWLFGHREDEFRSRRRSADARAASVSPAQRGVAVGRCAP